MGALFIQGGEVGKGRVEVREKGEKKTRQKLGQGPRKVYTLTTNFLCFTGGEGKKEGKNVEGQLE